MSRCEAVEKASDVKCANKSSGIELHKAIQTET